MKNALDLLETTGSHCAILVTDQNHPQISAKQMFSFILLRRNVGTKVLENSLKLCNNVLIDLTGSHIYEI